MTNRNVGRREFTGDCDSQQIMIRAGIAICIVHLYCAIGIVHGEIRIRRGIMYEVRRTNVV